MVSILASGSSYPRFKSHLQSIFSGKISDVAVLIDSALLMQWIIKKLKEVFQTHPVPASFKTSAAKNIVSNGS